MTEVSINAVEISPENQIQFTGARSPAITQEAHEE